MATLLVKSIAQFQTTLSLKVAAGATTGTLTSGVDIDGVQAPTATYGFLVDRNNSSKEYFTATLTGANLTAVKTVTAGTGIGTSGFAKAHRKGAEIIMTDHVVLKRLTDILDGTTALDGATPLSYDADPTFTDDKQFVTKKYADDIAIAGGADASTSVKGISKLSVAPVSSTNPIACGTNDGRLPTTDEKAALAGSGTPSASNKYVTVDTDALKELLSNKDTTGTLGTSDTKYPSQKAVKTYADTKMAGSGALGTWSSSSYASGTVTQAATDLFLVIGTIANGHNITVYSDSSNPPTTVRGAMSGINTTLCAICIPVKKGDYYKVTESSAEAVTLMILPLGS